MAQSLNRRVTTILVQSGDETWNDLEQLSNWSGFLSRERLGLGSFHVEIPYLPAKGGRNAPRQPKLAMQVLEAMHLANELQSQCFFVFACTGLLETHLVG